MTESEQILLKALQEAGVWESTMPAPDWFASLYEQLQTAHAHWSTLSLKWEDVCSRVATVISRSMSHQTPDSWVEKCHAEDLYLAFGCVMGSKIALDLIQEQYQKVLSPVVYRFANPPLMPDELAQELWIQLLVDTESRKAKIESYAGQGPLGGWIRVTAVRACIDYTRTHPHLQREQISEKESLMDLPDQTFDVELAFLKREYQSHFREAFARGLEALTSRERLLLRYHVLEGLSIDQIGALFQFHRSTAARQLQHAREHLLQATQQQLLQRLQIPEQELMSVIRLIQSKWEVSIQRLLSQQEEAEPQVP